MYLEFFETLCQQATAVESFIIDLLSQEIIRAGIS